MITKSKLAKEAAYLTGAINCAMGKVYPLDIGCEEHPIVSAVFELIREIAHSRQQLEVAKNVVRKLVEKLETLSGGKP